MPRWLGFTILAAAVVASILASREPIPGPGMIVALDNAVPGIEIDMLRATMPSGQEFLGGKLTVTPHFFSNAPVGALALGAAPDGRELPEWVEFEWKEWQYPYPEKPSDPVEEEKWSERIHELSRTLPHKTVRVLVRKRVPQDVVDEAIASNLAAPRGKLPEKQIWLYFVWHPDGIWFRWSLHKDSDVVRSGGDAIPARPWAPMVREP